MKMLVSNKRLYKAFHRAGLGSEEYYDSWTPLWALRSRIWNSEDLQNNARESLGELVKNAIEEGNSELFRHLAGALDEMLAFERDAENALRADVFFAVEELNTTRGTFTRAELLSWLNKQLDAAVSAEDLGRELELMDLAEFLPAG
jgi:hypothetical protein